MTEEHRELIHATVAEYIDQKECDCKFDIDPAKHRAHHESLDNFIATMDRVANLKWGIFRGVLQALIIAALFGVIIFMWQHGVNDG